MGTGRLIAATALALISCGFALSACGSGGASGRLTLERLPLVPGASIAVQTRQCDRGSDAFCAIQAVIVDRRSNSSGEFMKREQDHLHSLGWTTSAGDDGDEVAADSPGHKLRLTYATALDDLIGLDEKWIKRPWPIWASLSQVMFSGTPAISIMLELGPT